MLKKCTKKTLNIFALKRKYPQPYQKIQQTHILLNLKTPQLRIFKEKYKYTNHNHNLYDQKKER